jgi:predicted chitinase
MMIQPTMYFYLRYVPLFNGLYLITKVSHSIQPNNVVTNFEGVRMSSLNFPLVSEFISTITKEILEKGSSSVNFLTQQDTNFWDNLTNNTLKNRIITFYNAIKSRIDNPAVQAAMIAIAYKESKLIPKNESSYAGTNKHSVFKSFTNLRNYAIEGPNNTETSRFINELKLKDTTFFNFIYGTNPKAGEFENNPKTAKLNPIKITDSDGAVITVYDDENGDGYKYRGRGYNQITGKYTYELVKKDTGIDVVTNPDLLNNIDTATLALFYFMDRGAKGTVRQSTNQKNLFYQVYSETSLSNFDKENYQKAYNTLFSINAGSGYSMEVHLNNEIKKNGYNDGYFILQSIYRAIVDGKIK